MSIRTQVLLWGAQRASAAIHALFVAALAIHAPIGLRTILSETLNWRGRSLEVVILGFAVVLAVWGWRAVYAVFGAY